MKKLIAIFSVLLINISFAQKEQVKPAFSTLRYGFLAGISSGTASNTSGIVLAELSSNLIYDFGVKLSFGYLTASQPKDYTVNTYYEAYNNNKVIYTAETYQVNKNGYDIFPVSLGVEYKFENSFISPYLSASDDYNYLIGKVYIASGSEEMKFYSSKSEVPDKYKVNFNLLPDHSFGISFGAGAAYSLSS